MIDYQCFTLILIVFIGIIVRYLRVLDCITLTLISAIFIVFSQIM